MLEGIIILGGSMKTKICLIFLYLFGITFLLVGGVLQYDIDEKNIYQEANTCYLNLFSNDSLKSNILLKDTNSCKVKIKRVVDNKKKKALLQKVLEVDKYIIIRDEIFSIYVDGILNDNTTVDSLNNIKKKYDKLIPRYQKYVVNSIDDMEKQLLSIKNIKAVVKSLFTDDSMTIVKDNLTRDEYNNAVNLVASLKQNNLRSNQEVYLNTLNTVLTEREIIYQEKLKEEKRQREIAINNAWVVLNTPYISQNLTGVFNGCEAAALLMALKYKGYLPDMDLPNFARDMPKSNDPYQGFILDIFGTAPTNLTHWIAPEPLKNYGIAKSGNKNIINATGQSLTNLNNEISNNNPVVIYATAKFKNPKNWNGDVPNNLHVLLLAGYNKITGEQIIIDPWTHDNNFYVWQLSKNVVETIYNQVGKKAVIVR